jgi:methanogenic corrinoid protein MtbC1
LVLPFTFALRFGDRGQAAAILRNVMPLTAQSLDNLVVPALRHIGAGSARGEIPLDELYLSAKLCADLVAENLAPGQMLRPDQPRTAIGVLEDSHLLGSQIVQAVLGAAGYEVSDWGARLSVADIAARAAAEGTQLMLVSVLMLRAALRVAELPAALAERGSLATLVVGGAPFRFDPELAAEVGIALVAREATDILDIMVAQRGAVARPVVGPVVGPARAGVAPDA